MLRPHGDEPVHQNTMAKNHLKIVNMQLSYAAQARSIKWDKKTRLEVLSAFFDRQISSTKDLYVGELRLLYATLVKGLDREDFLDDLFSHLKEQK